MDQLLEDVIGRNNPFVEEDDIPEAGFGAADNESPVLKALQYLEDANMTLGTLLDAVLFGDESIRAHNKVIKARTGLFKDDLLVRAINRVCHPPQMRVRGKHHVEVWSKLEKWALDTSTEIMSKELAIFAKTTKSPASETEVVDEETLKTFTFDAMYEDIQQYAPRLYTVLSKICTGHRQERNKLKNPKFCITLFINALANQMSQYNNRMQKLICIYFKAKGVPKSVYYMFQPCGITTSYEWSVKALENISNAAMDMAAHIFDLEPCLGMYDNLRLKFAIKHHISKTGICFASAYSN